MTTLGWQRSTEAVASRLSRTLMVEFSFEETVKVANDAAKYLLSANARPVPELSSNDEPVPVDAEKAHGMLVSEKRESKHPLGEVGPIAKIVAGGDVVRTHNTKLRNVGVWDTSANETDATFSAETALKSVFVPVEDQAASGGFPGVHLESIDMHCGFAGCSGGWSKEDILSCDNDTMSCSKCSRRRDVMDVKGWITAMSIAPSDTNSVSSVAASGEQGDTDVEVYARPWFSYLKKMLQNDSASSAEMLCHLLLTHQKDMLTFGCGTHGRVELNALWLIYSLTDGSKTAYPLCPHLVTESVLLRDDLGISGVDEADL